jgi:hypothetical protein
MTTAFNKLAEKCAEVCRLRAENERLRSALEKIKTISNEEWGSDWQEIDLAREIAKQAISTT